MARRDREHSSEAVEIVDVNEDVETKKEVTIIPGINPWLDKPEVKTIITNIGFQKGAAIKYEVFVPVPQNDEQAKELYDSTMVYFAEAGARQVSTRVQFKDVFTGKEEITPDQHAELQKLMNSYRVGARSTGDSVKKKAALTDELMEIWGATDLNELKAKVAKMKAEKEE